MEKSVESLKQELEQMFDEMLRQIKLFKKRPIVRLFACIRQLPGAAFRRVFLLCGHGRGSAYGIR